MATVAADVSRRKLSLFPFPRVARDSREEYQRGLTSAATIVTTALVGANFLPSDHVNATHCISTESAEEWRSPRPGGPGSGLVTRGASWSVRSSQRFGGRAVVPYRFPPVSSLKKILQIIGVICRRIPPFPSDGTFQGGRPRGRGTEARSEIKTIASRITPGAQAER